jgi:hypothetical protein
MELKGKPLSLGAKILGAVIAIGALVLKATISPALDIDAAIKVAAFVVLIFAPIDLSIFHSFPRCLHWVRFALASGCLKTKLIKASKKTKRNQNNSVIMRPKKTWQP